MNVLAERRVRPAGRAGAQGGAAAPRARRRWRWCASPGSAAASRSSCPAGSASGSRSPAPSSTSPRCSCSTSRSARWTSSCARRCRSSSSGSSARSGSRFVYVTHDQEEALTMSDRLAVFNHGRHRAGRHADRGLRAARPASSSPGFIGVSNLLERGGRRFTIRPEKIQLAGRRRDRAGGQPRRARPHRGGRLPRHGHPLRGRARRGRDADRGAPEPARPRPPTRSRPRGGRVTVAWRDDQTYRDRSRAAGSATARQRRG